MLFLDDQYFTGEISIPNLPSSRMQDEYAFYGSAQMIQTSSENNLLVFVDNKVTEYLRLMFSDSLADELAQDWFEYLLENNKIKTSILSVDNSIQRNMWDTITLPNGIDADLIFQSFDVSGIDNITPKTERFGGIAITTLTHADFSIKIRVKSSVAESVDVYVSDGNIDTAFAINDVRSATLPRLEFRMLLNELLSYNGKTKVSPMANYVYYWLNRDGNNGTTAMGEADLNFSRASSAYEADKRLKSAAATNRLIRSWNDMVISNKRIIMFLRVNSELYTQYNICGTHWKNLTSTQNVFNL